MRTCLYAASIVAAGIMRPAIAAPTFTDHAYDVKLQYIGETSAQSVCVSFDASGRLSIGGRRTPLVWAARPEFPDQFLAVTAPLEGTGVHNAVGIHGSFSPDNALLASGIDQFGARFVLFGELRGGCDGDRNASRRADVDSDPTELVDPGGEFSGQVAPCASVICTPRTDPLRSAASSEPDQELIDPTGEFSGQVAPCASVICTPRTDPLRSAASSEPDQELIDPTGEFSGQVAPCASVICTPRTDPLRSAASSEPDQELIDPTGEFSGQSAPCETSFCDPGVDPTSVIPNRAIPVLAGQSFALTLGNDKEVVDYCWSFGVNGQIATAHGTSMTWTSNTRTLGDRGFESVGIGPNGQGMAYHGSMEGNMLKIVGIEAQDGKSSIVEGYGQPVARCEARW